MKHRHRRLQGTKVGELGSDRTSEQAKKIYKVSSWLLQSAFYSVAIAATGVQSALRNDVKSIRRY